MKIDGSSDDTGAFNAVKTGAAAGSIISLPSGDLEITSWPSTASKQNYWWLNGTTFNGGNPIFQIGTDPVFTTINDGWFFSRGGTTPDKAGATVRIDTSYNSSGGTLANVTPGLQTNCHVTNVSLNNFVWCNQTVLNTSAYGAGQHVAVSGTAFRPAGALSDNNGPRAEMWALYDESNDQTGLPSNLSGSMVGQENDVYSNGRDPGSNGDGGNRNVLQIEIAKSQPQDQFPRVGHGIVLGINDAGSYYGRELTTGGQWDTAAIDTSIGRPFTLTLPTGAAQSAAGSQLAFTSTDDGVEVGMLVTGLNIPPGTTVSSETSTVVILSSSTSSPVPSGTDITFTSVAPAIRIGSGQLIDLSGDGNHTVSYKPGTGLNYANHGVTELTVADSGNVTMNGSLSVTGHYVDTGSPPTITDCGSQPSISATASDRHGTVIPGSGASSCTIQFAAAYGAAPDILLTGWASQTTPFVQTASTTSVTVGFATAGKFSYMVEQ